MFSGNGAGTSGDPYQITSWAQLDEIRDDLTAHYILMNDLDENSAGYNTYASATANNGKGWIPIGLDTDQQTILGVFTGSLDGDFHTISNLRMDNTARGDVERGLGFIFQIFSTVKNIALLDVKVDTAGRRCGTLGRNIQDNAEISNCYVQGSITSSRSINVDCGALCWIFFENASIENIWTDVTITSTNNAGRIGGLVADMRRSTSSINNCYAIGEIITTSNFEVNGLVGRLHDGASASQTTNSFWDEDTVGVTSGTAGTGKTNAEMKDRDTFTDTATAGLTTAWDMAAVDTYDDTKVWGIGQLGGVTINDGYPYLMGFQEESEPSGTFGLKLGSTTINKVMLGSTEIKKIYLGTTVIYENL